MDKTIKLLLGKGTKSYTSMSEQLLRAYEKDISTAQIMADAAKLYESVNSLAANISKRNFEDTSQKVTMQRMIGPSLAIREFERIFLRDASKSFLINTSEVNRMAFNTTAHALLTCSRNEKLSCSLESSAAFREFMNHEAERQVVFEKSFRLPVVIEYANLAEQAINSSALASKVFSGASALLSEMMSGMNAAWLRTADAQVSVAAFADIQAIGHLATSGDPFDSGSSAAIRTVLGDWREEEDFSTELYAEPISRSAKYLEHGYDPSLTDFPVPAFERAVKVAGLEILSSDEELDPDLNNRAYCQLFQFEKMIRKFIVAAMSYAYGDGWMKRQLPSDMYDNWSKKKNSAEKYGDHDLSPIEYADFTDYIRIIERNDNWNKVFKDVFHRKEDVRESFQRLHPIRLTTMHSRIITLDDDLLLLVETRRIIQSIKRSNFRF